MTEEQFTPEQSLHVIRSMIEKVKQDLSDNSFWLLLWGWLVLAAALTHYVLQVWIGYPHAYLAWNLMWIGAIISIVYGIRHERRAKVKTYMEETMRFFGIGTGIMFCVLAFVFGHYQLWQYAFPVYFIIYGFLSFATGSIIRFVFLRWAAAICWIIAVIAVFVDFETHLLLMALAVLFAYIIPGYLLRNKFKKQTT